MRPPRITYLTDDEVVKAWRATIDEAGTLRKLKQELKAWAELAPDAVERVKTMTGGEFEEWRRGLQVERRGEFVGEEWAASFGMILLPTRLYRTSLAAHQFHVPWGVAWARLKELGRLDADG